MLMYSAQSSGNKNKTWLLHVGTLGQINAHNDIQRHIYKVWLNILLHHVEQLYTNLLHSLLFVYRIILKWDGSGSLGCFFLDEFGN